MIAKYDWFCEMKCRSGSERITRAFRSWERYFCVQETEHNQTQLFCESRETGIIFTYFHILMNRISNLKHFLSQVHKFTNSNK